MGGGCGGDSGYNGREEESMNRDSGGAPTQAAITIIRVSCCHAYNTMPNTILIM